MSHLEVSEANIEFDGFGWFVTLFTGWNDPETGLVGSWPILGSVDGKYEKHSKMGHFEKKSIFAIFEGREKWF